MDARIDPLAVLGLEVGDAAVLRNAGALVTEDVLRSLAVSYALLDVVAATVVGHTERGLHGATSEELRALAGTGDEVDVLPFTELEESARAGVRKIRKSPLLPASFRTSGFVYDVRSGRLRGL